MLRVKAQSDAHVQHSALDWTVVRPGGLTDEPGTGLVHVASTAGRGSIPRDDVATVVLACLGDPATVGQTFEVVSGNDAVAGALAGLGS